MARTRPRWRRIYPIATWFLIGLFTFLAAAHLVLTALFFIGVWDTGVGYVLDFEWPAWLITLIDATAAASLWSGYRRVSSQPWLGLVLSSVAAALMVARASWMVLVPIAVVLTVAGSIARVVTSRRPIERHAESA